MMKHFMAKSDGFTLVEALLGIGALAILGIGISALAYLYVVFGQRLPQESLRSEVLRAHQQSLELMKRAIRESEAIEASYSIGPDNYVTGTTTLVLRTKTIDATGAVLAGQYDRFIFFLSGTTTPYTLEERIEPSSGSALKQSRSIINNMVKNLSFAYNATSSTAATSVKIELVTEKSDGRSSFTATSTIEVTLH